MGYQFHKGTVIVCFNTNHDLDEWSHPDYECLDNKKGIWFICVFFDVCYVFHYYHWVYLTLHPRKSDDIGSTKIGAMRREVGILGKHSLIPLVLMEQRSQRKCLMVYHNLQIWCIVWCCYLEKTNFIFVGVGGINGEKHYTQTRIYSHLINISTHTYWDSVFRPHPSPNIKWLSNGRLYPSRQLSMGHHVF